MVDNKKFKPDNYLTETKVSSKPNKNKKGEITSHSYSTVIPKPVLNKLGLYHGQKLYWDINKDNTITITPELPETQSIEAGFEILDDMLFNNNTKSYTQLTSKTTETLKLNITKEAKVDELTNYYNTLPKPTKYEYKILVCYMLDCAVTPEKHQVLQQVYDEITKTD